MKQGDYCVRISYGKDVIFRIEYIIQNTAVLRGVEFRLIADAPLSDLERVEGTFSNSAALGYDLRFTETRKRMEQFRKVQVEKQMRTMGEAGLESSYFEVPGKVLHLDGDASYLRKSMDLYRRLKVPVEGHYVAEKDMADALLRLLPNSRPDIVVITGHDGMIKSEAEQNKYHLSSYKNSTHFVKAIRAARQFEKNIDTLTVIAGACQSHFEALLQAGANFASSPGRILIHALDPVQIACKVSYTSIQESVNMMDVISNTVSGIKGMGGIETRGSYRIGLPNIQHM
ncbi:sporulation peptidase YabG [Marinicrinis lubricantis]|uniref:Sporulation peptidase YabG n=1 Tax=Marinicrinis lubricantis TaxID=2086470 RepID=A0ABW1IQA7_9BACL